MLAVELYETGQQPTQCEDRDNGNNCARDETFYREWVTRMKLPEESSRHLQVDHILDPNNQLSRVMIVTWIVLPKVQHQRRWESVPLDSDSYSKGSILQVVSVETSPDSKRVTCLDHGYPQGQCDHSCDTITEAQATPDKLPSISLKYSEMKIQSNAWKTGDEYPAEDEVGIIRDASCWNNFDCGCHEGSSVDARAGLFKTMSNNMRGTVIRWRMEVSVSTVETEESVEATIL